MAKTIPLGDLSLLKKTLGMTASEHDGEALAALRKSLAIMRRHGVTWTDIFDRLVGTTQQVAPAQRGADELRPSTETDLTTMIQNAFDELRGTDLGDFRGFVDSIERTFASTNYLSPEQRKPLFDAVVRHRKRRGRDE